MIRFAIAKRFPRDRRVGCTSLLLAAVTAATPAPSRAAASPSVAHPATPGQNALVEQALAAEAQLDVATALSLFRQARAAGDERAFVLQKIAKQCSDLASDVDRADEQRQLCRDALACAQQAVELEPNAVNVLSVAIVYGKLALLSDVRSKIEYSRLVRDYAERALALNPNFADAHHVLGRWNTELAALGPTRRFLVQMIYGRIPDASVEAALRHLRRAIALAPDVPAHRVELGFALLAAGQREAARDAFLQAQAFRPRERYDVQEIRRAQAALRNPP